MSTGAIITEILLSPTARLVIRAGMDAAIMGLLRDVDGKTEEELQGMHKDQLERNAEIMADLKRMHAEGP